VNVDVAVLDTGVDPAHPDLNVAGTVNCIGQKYASHVHGTHVAGTIGAIDNRRGVVGVAPGARIWGIRIFNQQDLGTVSSLLCGLDWVDRNKNVIDVANLSGTYGGFDGGDCGISDDDPAHALVCSITGSGIPFAAAAGNESADTAGSLPAAYDEVIAVSAFTDYDGRPGSLSQPTCYDVGADDGLAFFSNFGADVDIAAPGVCILSSWIHPDYEYEIGTSMASPHVAGAAALYKAAHPSASAARVKAALLAAAQQGPLPGDSDGFAEPLLNIAGL
jgi:subtilisin family serine protease